MWKGGIFVSKMVGEVGLDFWREERKLVIEIVENLSEKWKNFNVMKSLVKVS